MTSISTIEPKTLKLTSLQSRACRMIGLEVLNGLLVLNPPLGHTKMLALVGWFYSHGSYHSLGYLIQNILKASWESRKHGHGCLVCGRGPLQPHSSDPTVCFGQNDPILWRIR